MFLYSVSLPDLAIKKAQCSVIFGFKISREFIFRISMFHAIWGHTYTKNILIYLKFKFKYFFSLFGNMSPVILHSVC